MIDRPGLAAHVTTDRYVGGLLDRRGGHLHPLNLALGEAAAFEALRGRVHEASPAIAIDHGPDVTVRTEAGAVRAGSVLVCGNAYLGPLLRHELGRHIMPVSTQILATEPLGERARALLPSNVCVEDANYILDYYRRTADDRLLYGGGVVYGGRDPASIERRILPALHRTFPSLAGVRIDHAWSGNFALTLTRIPHVGRLRPGLYFSHGDSGHGVTTTHLLGRLLAEAVVATEAGQSARFDLFAGLRPLPFPGGQAMRVPLAVLGSWYYRMRDRFV
jgi:gamma-glutamylputrescine oxidase